MPTDASNLQALAGAPLLTLTTTGRTTHKMRTVDLWFAYHHGVIYLLGHTDSQWVKNLAVDPHVQLEIDDTSFSGVARFVDEKRALAFQLFERKYGAQQIAYWYRGEGAQRRTVEITLVLPAH